MSATLIQWNVVVTANQFNPSVFSQIWLVRQGIIKEDQLVAGQGTIFSDAVVQAFTPSFSLVVVPEQLQLAPKEDPRSAAEVVKIVSTLIEKLPHTPIKACGMNFLWHLKEEKKDFSQLTRDLFAGRTRATSHFDAPDARFGGYFSMNINGSRLRLDAKPVTTILPDGSTSEALQVQCNFHRDLAPESAVDELRLFVNEWATLFEVAEQLLAEVTIVR